MLDVLTVLEMLAVLAVLFVAACVATRAGDVLVDAPPDAPDLGLPQGAIEPEDVAEVRFGLALRGYRMREVDEVLARLAAELAARDTRLSQLERALVEVVEPELQKVEERLGLAAVNAPAESSPWPARPDPGMAADDAGFPAGSDDFPEVQLPEPAPEGRPDATHTATGALPGEP